MKKSNKLKEKKLIIAAIIIVIALIGVIVYKSGLMTANLAVNESLSNQTKTFQSSDVMDFSITVPNNYEIKENFGSIIIDAREMGKIQIGRSGTNFVDLSQYLSDLHLKNNSQVVSSEKEIINSYQTYKQSLVNEDLTENNRIAYFIYVNGFVYSLSTSSESLFGDLDQIARSFQYTDK